MDLQSFVDRANETTKVSLTISYIYFQGDLSQPLRFITQILLLCEILFFQDIQLVIRSLSLLILSVRYLGLVLLLETTSLLCDYFQINDWPCSRFFVMSFVRFIGPCIELGLPTCILFHINSFYETFALYTLIFMQAWNILRNMKRYVENELFVENSNSFSLTRRF